MNFETGVTIEEYSLPENPHRLVTIDGVVDEIEAVVEIDADPGEPQTYDDPGYPPSAEIVGVKVTEITFEDGSSTTLKAFRDMVAAWLYLYWADDQGEWALERAADDQGEWALERAAEEEGDRDEGYEI